MCFGISFFLSFLLAFDRCMSGSRSATIVEERPRAQSVLDVRGSHILVSTSSPILVSSTSSFPLTVWNRFLFALLLFLPFFLVFLLPRLSATAVAEMSL